MRKTLNDNPVAQIGILAVLALLVAFLLMTRLGGSASEAPPAATTPSADATDTTATPGTATDTPSTPTPSTATPPATSSDFIAGPGLPKPVVTAYNHGDSVVLLITKYNGIDDSVIRASVERLGGHSDVTLFVTNAKHIADYSRITEGVDVDRVPALVVMRPKDLSESGTPEAAVSYGFRGENSIVQAVRDALYTGKSNLPFYP